MSGIRRRSLLGLALGAALLVGVLGLGLIAIVIGALRAAAAERELAHQVLADRAFDAMEAELSELVAREEARSFLQYRRAYTPEGLIGGAGARVRSPLADPPADRAVIGYFQVEPDGTLTTPLQPEPGEAPSSAEAAEAAGRVLALAAPVLDAPGAGPAPSDEAPAQQLAQNRYDVERSLNKGSVQRKARVEKQERRKVEEVQSFQSDWSPSAYLGREAPSRPSAEIPAAGAERGRPLGAGLNPEDLAVTVSPLVGLPGDEGTLLLYRDVRLAGALYRQGLVLDRRLTLALLADHALAGSLLEELAVVPPEGERPVDAADWPRRYEHTFDAPFQDLRATLWMKPVPDQGTSVGWILGLSVALGLVGGLGLLAVGAQVVSTVRFAERRANFVAAVSHELKTPLTAIRMYAEMLRDDLVPSDEKRREYYAIIGSESERLTRLIQNVLELAKLERGRRVVALEVGDPSEVLGEVARTLGPHAAERGFALELQIDGPLPAARYDRDALTQVLVNLVDNAIKFSAEAADRRVVLQAGADGDGLFLRVRDHGPGVPPRQLRHVFEPFWRGERELVRRTQGTGIGLALVDGLARAMGARARAWNAPEGGLVVELRLAPA